MRYTFMSDGYAAVDNDVCYEDQNEDYCGDAIDKLAAYEDTGYTPEECATIAKSYPRLFDMVYELQKYKDAEADGRMVVLPCKVGDTAYVIWDSTIYPENPPAVREDHITQVKFTKKGCAFKTWRGWYHKSDIGKTVFLTRSEAEAALKSNDKQTIFYEKEN